MAFKETEMKKLREKETQRTFRTFKSKRTSRGKGKMMNDIAEKDNTLVKWLEKNQIKVEMVESLQSLHIITLNDLKNAELSLLEERVISQLKPVPAKKLRESLASLREIPALPPKDEISSSVVGAISAEPNPLPVSVEEKKETFPLPPAPEIKPISLGSRPVVIGMKKAVDDLNSLTIEELQKELEREKNKVEELQRRKARHEDRLKKIQHLLKSKTPPNIASAAAPARTRFSFLTPSSKLAEEKKEEQTPWKCSMCKRENKAEDEKCLDCFTEKSKPFSPPLQPKKVTGYRCRKCCSVNRFRTPCQRCKSLDYEPIYEGDAYPRVLFQNRLNRPMFYRPPPPAAANSTTTTAATTTTTPETKKVRPLAGIISLFERVDAAKEL